MERFVDDPAVAHLLEMSYKDPKKSKWRITPRDEQETIIHVNYEDGLVMLYTTRKAVARRFEKAAGEPDVTYRLPDEGICAVEWRRTFAECGILFHKSKIVGAVASKMDSESEEPLYGDDVGI